MLATYWALGRYFQGQKTERLQRIYYENAVIAPLEHLEKLLSIVNKNSILFQCLNHYLGSKLEAAIDILKNDSTIKKSKEDIFKEITSPEYIKEIAKNIKAPAVQFRSNELKQILKKAIDKDSVKYFNGWIGGKAKNDISQIMGMLKNIAANYVDYLTTDQKYVPFSEETILHLKDRANDAMTVIKKHIILIDIANEFKQILAGKNYKNQKTLIKKNTKRWRFLISYA